MNSYVFGTSLSYEDYLVGKSFVSDITSASRDASRRVSMDISQQTRKVIASNEALARDNIQAMEASTDQVSWSNWCVIGSHRGCAERGV